MTEHTEERRDYIGGVFRLTLDFIRKSGLFEAMAGELSPGTKALVDKLPGRLSWIGCGPMDELESLVVRHGGSKAAFDLGLLAGREFGGSIMQPVLKMAVSLFGNTPATLFANLERFYPFVTKGYHFNWEPQGDRGGVVEVRWDPPKPPSALFDVTRGNFQYVTELIGSKDFRIEPPQIVRHDDTGALVRYAVAW
jgi:hypothetical protein